MGGGVLKIGSWNFYGSPYAMATDVKIHTLRVYNRALTPAEIKANYEIDKIRFNLP